MIYPVGHIESELRARPIHASPLPLTFLSFTINSKKPVAPPPKSFCCHLIAAQSSSSSSLRWTIAPPCPPSWR